MPVSPSLTLLPLRSSLWRLARPSKDPLVKVRRPSVADLMLRLFSLVSPRKALSGISWKLQSMMLSSSSHTRLLKPRGSSWLTDTVSVQMTVRATVWSAGITLKFVLSAWLLMADRWQASSRAESAPSLNGLEKQSAGTGGGADTGDVRERGSWQTRQTSRSRTPAMGRQTELIVTDHCRAPLSSFLVSQQSSCKIQR